MTLGADVADAGITGLTFYELAANSRPDCGRRPESPTITPANTTARRLRHEAHGTRLASAIGQSAESPSVGRLGDAVAARPTSVNPALRRVRCSGW